MPLEIKDIQEYLGIEADSIDDFRTKYEKAYIKRDMIAEDQALMGSLVGRIAGTTETELRRSLKSAGIEVGDGEYKGGKIEKHVADAFKKMSDHYGAKIKELESNTAPDEKLTALQSQLEKEKKAKADLQTLLEQSKEQYNTEKGAWEGKFKDYKRQTQLAEVFKNTIKWKSGATDIEKEGFNSIVGKKYKIDFDEKDNLVPYTIDGHRIPNPKKNGEFKDLASVLEEEGKAANIWETNPNTKGKSAPQIYQPTNQQRPEPNPVFQGRQRILSERARANEGKV